jgi:hypothetical protein
VTNLDDNYTKPKKKKKGLLIILLIAVVIFLGLVILIIITSQPPEGFELSESLPAALAARNILAEGMDLTPEQEAAVLEIFDSVGIGEIVSASEFQRGEEMTSFWLDDVETRHWGNVRIVVWLDNATKEINSIYFHDYTLWEDGEFVSLITNYYVPQEILETLHLATQLLISDFLIAPSTASWESRGSGGDWSFGRQDLNFIVQSHVTSHNAFGVPIRMPFQVTWDAFAMPISVIIDGEEVLSTD